MAVPVSFRVVRANREPFGPHRDGHFTEEIPLRRAVFSGHPIHWLVWCAALRRVVPSECDDVIRRVAVSITRRQQAAAVSITRRQQAAAPREHRRGVPTDPISDLEQILGC